MLPDSHQRGQGELDIGAVCSAKLPRESSAVHDVRRALDYPIRLGADQRAKVREVRVAAHGGIAPREVEGKGDRERTGWIEIRLKNSPVLWIERSQRDLHSVEGAHLLLEVECDRE